MAGIGCKAADGALKAAAGEAYSSKAYIIQLSNQTPAALPANYDELSRYNCFGICWSGRNIDDILSYAKQMGYSYVFYRPGMEKSPLASDLFFYIETPETSVCWTLGVDSTISPAKAYTEVQKDTYQRYFSLRNASAAFPDNMAPGWTRPGTSAFTVLPDWQQQRAIDYFVAQVTAYAKTLERPEKKFLAAGVAWDVPQLRGDFHGGGTQDALVTWTGKDSTALFSGCAHQYNSYTKGTSAYYLALRQSLKAQFPGRRLTYIYEPYDFYNSWFVDLETLDRTTRDMLMEDALVTQECGVEKWATGTEFVDDARVYKKSLVAKNHAGSTTPDNHDLANNKKIAGKAAINGAWFNWYGRFSGSGDQAAMRNIREVPNWLQLIRLVANWDNLNGVPLAARNVTNGNYSSANSSITDNVIYSRQPKTQKLFVVFLNDSGETVLNPGEKIVSVKRVDALFRETVDGSGDVTVSGSRVRLRAAVRAAGSMGAAPICYCKLAL